VGDDLLEVLGHPLQLRVKVLRQLISSFSVGVYGDGADHRLLERPKRLLKLGLLAADKVQLVLQPLLVLPHSGDGVVETKDLLAVLDQELVPGVHLGGLVDELLLHVFKF